MMKHNPNAKAMLDAINMQIPDGHVATETGFDASANAQDPEQHATAEISALFFAEMSTLALMLRKKGVPMRVIISALAASTGAQFGTILSLDPNTHGGTRGDLDDDAETLIDQREKAEAVIGQLAENVRLNAVSTYLLKATGVGKLAANPTKGNA